MPTYNFSDLAPHPGDSDNMLLAKILTIFNNATSGGGGFGIGSVLMYSGTDPNEDYPDGPPDPTQPALAYSQDGLGSIYGWNTATLTWV